MAFVNLGLVPDTGGSYLLVKQLGPKRAMDICATGRPVSAQEAKNLGIVYRIVSNDALDEETMKFAKKLAAGPIISYKNIKRQIYAAAFAEYQHYLETSKSHASVNVPGPRTLPKASARSWKTASPFTGQ